jgi:hypothetical protein
MRSGTRAVLFVQAAYFLLTGLWPIVSIDTFQLVTGPKTDLWLVQMVGLLAATIGLTLALAAFRRKLPIEILVLSFAAITSFTVIDVIYVAAGIIDPIYLVDAAVEVIFAVLLVFKGRPSE